MSEQLKQCVIFTYCTLITLYSLYFVIKQAKKSKISMYCNQCINVTLINYFVAQMLQPSLGFAYILMLN